VDSVQRMVSSPEDPAPRMRPRRAVPAGTRDPFGTFAVPARHRLDKTPEINSPVYDGRKFYEVRAVLLSKAEAVNVPAEITRRPRSHPRVRGGAEMKDAHFLLYLSNDDRAPSRPAGSRAASSHGARGTDQAK